MHDISDEKIISYIVLFYIIALPSPEQSHYYLPLEVLLLILKISRCQSSLNVFRMQVNLQDAVIKQEVMMNLLHRY